MTNDTWIVVADASRARIYATDLDLEEWVSVGDLVHPESRADSKELVSDMHDTTARRGPRSRPTPRVDRHDFERDRFAHELAEHLQGALSHGEFEHLVLVAPPRMMGALRGELNGDLKEHVTAEILKDYSLQRPDQLHQSVREQLSQLLH